MTTCPVCGQWVWAVGRPETHRCPPKWLVWNAIDDDAQDGRAIYATDAESAAEAWAEQDDLDSAEYDIVNGSPAEVFVERADGKEPRRRCRVGGEYVTSYSAELVDDAEAP